MLSSKILVLLVFLSLLVLFSLLHFSVDFEFLTLQSNVFYRQRHVHRFKEPYPPMLIGAYAEPARISVSVAALKPIGYTVYCRYFERGGKELRPPAKSLIYPLFVVFCEPRDGAHRIAITDGDDGDVLEHFQMTIFRWNESNTRFLTHCTAPIFGNEPKWLHLVEMIEHYKLEGVSKFYVYIREISPYDMQLLQFYSGKLGEVEIIEIPSIYIDAVSQQLLAVADCHLRNRLSANWTIFSDIDERMIMTEESETISEFLRDSLGELYGAVQFAQRWIFKHSPLPATFSNYQQIMDELPTRKWTLSTQPGLNCSDGKHCWGKMIVNNRKVVQMLVHDVGEYEPGFEPWILDPSVGYIRHYRDVQMGNWVEKNRGYLETLRPYENTTYSEHLKSRLLSNVLRVLHSVYGVQQ